MQDRSSTTRIHELAAQARTQEFYLPLGGTDPDILARLGIYPDPFCRCYRLTVIG